MTRPASATRTSSSSSRIPATARVTQHGPAPRARRAVPEPHQRRVHRAQPGEPDALVDAGLGARGRARRCRAAPARARRPRSRITAGSSATGSSCTCPAATSPSTSAPRCASAGRCATSFDVDVDLERAAAHDATPRRSPAAAAHRHRGRPRCRPATGAARRHRASSARDLSRGRGGPRRARAARRHRRRGAGRDRAAAPRPSRPRAPTSARARRRSSREMAEALDVDVVIFDDELSPAQQRNLEKLFKRRRRRPRRADPRHLRPARGEPGGHGAGRARAAPLPPAAPAGSGHRRCRQQGVGIGTRGPGETQLEVDRRRIQRRITKLERDLDAARPHPRDAAQGAPRAARSPTVALVGYTNAGKSTLLNRLTDAEVLVEDRLFSTLDPSTRRLRLPGGETVLLSDTVGFVRRLPAPARRVVPLDARGGRERRPARPPRRRERRPTSADRIDAVRSVLREIDAGRVPEQLVFTKTDTVDAETVAAPPRVASRRRSACRRAPATGVDGAARGRSGTACARSSRSSSCRSRTTGATSSPACTATATVLVEVHEEGGTRVRARLPQTRERPLRRVRGRRLPASSSLPRHSRK